MIPHLVNEPRYRLFSTGIVPPNLSQAVTRRSPVKFLPGTRAVVKFDGGDRQVRIRQYKPSRDGKPDTYMVHDLLGSDVGEAWIADPSEMSMERLIPQPGDEVLVMPSGNRRPMSVWGTVESIDPNHVLVNTMWPEARDKTKSAVVAVNYDELAYPTSWRVILGLRFLDFSKRPVGEHDPGPAGLYQWVSFWMPRVHNFFTDKAIDYHVKQRQINLIRGETVFWMGGVAGVGLDGRVRKDLETLLDQWDQPPQSYYNPK